MGKVSIPAVNKIDGITFNVQIYISYDYEDSEVIVTGLVDHEIEQSIFISLTLLKKEGIELPSYTHIHFADYNYTTSGISASLGIYLSLYQKYTNFTFKNTYLITGEIDIEGNIYEIGDLKEKYGVFIKSKANYFIIPESNYRNDLYIREDNKVIGVKDIGDLKQIIIKLEKNYETE